MKDSVFREYDIRGVVGEDFIIDDVYAVTRAVAYYFLQQNPLVKTVVVGIDGRTHSPQIGQEVCRAFSDSGLQVLFIGVCASPVLYYALHTLPVDGGIMITASHNPKEFNGMKISLGIESVHGKQLQEVKELYHAGKKIDSEVPGLITQQTIIPAYVDWLVDHFPSLMESDLGIIFDCGNAVAGTVIPLLVERFKFSRAHILYADIDGTFPNHEADPVVAKNMQAVKQAMQTYKADVGIGFDGDADRMGAMTQKGFLIPGDMLLALFAQPIMSRHEHETVVCNVLASSGLVELVRSWGGTVYMAPAGHSNIKEAMKKYKARIGGESSCHFFFADRHFGYDDGIYAALRLCELLVQSKKTLDELLEIFPKRISSREYRIPCKETDKNTVIQAVFKAFQDRPDTEIITTDGIRIETPYGWGIVRKSNTQPVLSLRFESDTQAGYDAIKKDLIAVLGNYFDAVIIQELQEE